MHQTASNRSASLAALTAQRRRPGMDRFGGKHVRKGYIETLGALLKELFARHGL